MAFCTQCGKEMDDAMRFCPICGAPATQGGTNPAQQASAQQTAPPQQPAAPAGGYQAPGGGQTWNQNPYVNPEQMDINNNKGYAILSYFSLLVLIPIFAAKDSKFARFHANQGLVLMIAEVVYWIAVAIVTAIFMAINWWLGSIFSTIFALGNILFLVLAILGIVAAAQGQYKTLPIIGKISILK